MTVSVDRVSRAAVAKLISSSDEVTLSDVEKETFSRCLAQTTLLWMGKLDGKLICAWGLIPPTLLSDQAYLWLFTTPALAGHEFLFVRRSQIEVRAMLEEFPIIVGWTNVAWTQTIRWLRWLGAEFEEPLGARLPFIIRKK